MLIFMMAPAGWLLEAIHPGWGGWAMILGLAPLGVFIGLGREWACEKRKAAGEHQRTCGNMVRRRTNLFLIGLAMYPFCGFILVAFMANPSQKPFDDPLGMQCAGVFCGAVDHRQHMRQSVLDWLNGTHPDRDAALTRLGAPLIEHHQRMIYGVGPHVVNCMTLEIDFDESDRVAKAKTHAD